MCRRAFVSLVRRGTVTGVQVWPAQVLVGVALRGGLGRARGAAERPRPSGGHWAAALG